MAYSCWLVPSTAAQRRPRRDADDGTGQRRIEEQRGRLPWQSAQRGGLTGRRTCAPRAGGIVLSEAFGRMAAKSWADPFDANVAGLDRSLSGSPRNTDVVARSENFKQQRKLA